MSAVLLEVRDGVAYVRLNRPDAMNSLNLEVLDGLDGAVASAIKNERVKAIVLEGDDRAFSTGADLRTVVSLFDKWPEYMRYVERIGSVFNAIERASVPTIAKVRGYALAGGLELLLACDMAVAADDARIGDQHANYGLMAGGGGIPRLIRRIGLQPALEILFTGRWLSGQEAARLGIVLRSVPATELDGAVNSITDLLIGKSRTSLRYIKQAARAGLDKPLETALKEERSALFEYFRTSPHPRHGIEAFLTKTIPVFEPD